MRTFFASLILLVIAALLCGATEPIGKDAVKPDDENSESQRIASSAMDRYIEYLKNSQCAPENRMMDCTIVYIVELSSEARIRQDKKWPIGEKRTERRTVDPTVEGKYDILRPLESLDNALQIRNMEQSENDFSFIILEGLELIGVGDYTSLVDVNAKVKFHLDETTQLLRKADFLIESRKQSDPFDGISLTYVFNFVPVDEESLWLPVTIERKTLSRSGKLPIIKTEMWRLHKVVRQLQSKDGKMRVHWEDEPEETQDHQRDG